MNGNGIIDGWMYYRYAAVPTCAPHEKPDLGALENGTIWSGGALFARWTEDFDCGHETNFWYVVKDTPFDISALKSNRRYKITKGKRNFDVRLIERDQYAGEMFEVCAAAFTGWPKKYRPVLERESFVKQVAEGCVYKTYGAFEKQSGRLEGYVELLKNGRCLSISVLRTNPEYEKLQINAAIIHHMLTDNEEAISQGCYICNGTRSIRHETLFNDYLEKYFGFRKAYCSLKIVYAKKIRWLIKVLRVLRPILKKLDNIGKIHEVNSLLFMDTLA